MIVIIDYGIGNLGSVKNMLKKIGYISVISSDIPTISDADRLILPGVGSFNTGMNNIINLGLLDVIRQKVLVDKIPILGICLGMQLLSNRSEEGNVEGLGFIEGETFKLNFPEKDRIMYKVPHMGWNYVELKKQSRLFTDMYPNQRFYFVHSYYLKTNCKNDILTSTFYGMEITSSVEKDNIIGVQFHPEKSHKFGMKLLQNFVELY